MLGYVTTNADTLDKAQKDRYQACYCGLCRQLGLRHGAPGRASLTYDMTFLSMLLSALYEEPEEAGTFRCPANPLRQCAYVGTKVTEYAADMNVLLAYYNALDDWKDDHSVTALGICKALEKKAERVKTLWPRQSEVIISCLKSLGDMEKANDLNPDNPANCFGYLMGELFAWKDDDEWTPALRRMGAALGRFIYLMDASLDLPSDIRHERYNPLVAQLDTDFTEILTMIISECTAEFEQLPLQGDVEILRNILYAGVWVQYKSKKEGGAKRDE